MGSSDSSHNETQLNATVENRQSGQEVAKVLGKKRSLAKTHKDFWKERLEKRSYTQHGQSHQVNEWSVRIQHLGKRKGFALGTNNAEAAAVKARDIYLKVVAEGWEAAEAKYNPQLAERKNDPTLGEFFAAVKSVSGLKPKTFRTYSGYFRRIVSEMFGLRSADRFSYRSGGTAEWQQRVDSVKLSAINSGRLKEWRRMHVAKAGNSPVARESATRSSNSYLRCSRSLFAKKWLNDIETCLRLPKPLPFEGVQVQSGRSKRYISRINIETLVKAARMELRDTSPAVYLSFLLALGAGLRKAEIDGLEWTHINFEGASISVQSSAHRDLKSEASHAEVQIDFGLRDELHRFHKKKTGLFVIEAPGRHRPELDRQHYRAEAVFERLYEWLRKEGVDDPKPLHALRKEFGSRINQRFGIYAAMTALRHSDIATTANHYLANTERIALSLDGFGPGETKRDQ